MSATELASVHALVLNWNGLVDTLNCVEALQRLEAPQPRVVVVDNGSRESPRPALTARFLDVETIENRENLGYAGGNNVGIRHALAAGAGFVWVLNNDALPEPNALVELLSTARAHPRAAAVGSKVVYADNPETIWAAWGEITWRQSLIRLPGHGQRDEGSFGLEREVEWVPGCSVLLRREALEEVGLFDESFFAYHEDADWGARARKRGWQSWYNGRSVVRHAVHGSSGGVAHYGGFRKYLSARNSILYARRHGSALQKARLGAAILATLPFQYLRRLVSGEAAGVVDKVKGWRDGLAGRPIPLVDLGLHDEPPQKNPWQHSAGPG